MESKNCKFKLKEKVKTNVFNILVNYEGGDADTKHPRIYEIEGVTALNYNQPHQWAKVVHQLEIIKAAKQVLDDDGRHFNYDVTEEEYGADVADFCDDVPKDPQADYQFKCYIDDIELQLYDSQGNLFHSYIN